ncbi:MAG TPA: hypothetical protein VGM10_19635 [Actinocrinis sp.]|jgi:hypothetical protein
MAGTVPGTSRSKSQIPDAAHRKHEKFQAEQNRNRTLRHRTTYTTTGLVVLAAAALTIALWPRHHDPTPPTPVSQVDTAVDPYAQNNPKTTLKFITIAGPTTTSNAITTLPTTGLTATTIATLTEHDFS